MRLNFEHLAGFGERMAKNLYWARFLLLCNTTEECSSIVHDSYLIQGNTLLVICQLFDLLLFLLLWFITFLVGNIVSSQFSNWFVSSCCIDNWIFGVQRFVGLDTSKVDIFLFVIPDRICFIFIKVQFPHVDWSIPTWGNKSCVIF